MEEGKKCPARRGISSDLRHGTDALIAELARRQDGRVTRKQLLAAGISRSAIDRRVWSGQLHREHEGVYAVGYRRREIWGRFRSALMAVGEDATIALLAAAHGHGFGAEPVLIDVACPRKLPPRAGIRLHHHALEPWQVERVNNLPLTSPAQTLFDLASLLSEAKLAKTANEAFVVTDLTIAQLHAVKHANARRRGSTAFATLLARIDPEAENADSPLELRLYDFLRARGFPDWESNVTLRIGNELIRPDVLWRSERVIVEADGRDPHLAPLNFDRDRRRDRRCRVEGWEPVRVASHDLGPGADELDADLRRLLGL